jgi:hypothetical protein
MTYKVTLSGSSKEETMASVKRQVEGAMGNGNMSRESADQISRILDGMPGTHLSGTISDNNNGTVVVAITARTKVDADVVSKMKSGQTGNASRKMEGEDGNSGGAVVNRSTTGAGAAVASSSAAAAAVKPNTSAQPVNRTTAATGGTTAAQGSNANAGSAGEGEVKK